MQSENDFLFTDLSSVLTGEAREYVLDRLIGYEMNGVEQIELKRRKMKQVWSGRWKEEEGRILVTVGSQNAYPEKDSLSFKTRTITEGGHIDRLVYVRTGFTISSDNEAATLGIFYFLFWYLRSTKQIGGRKATTNAARFAAQNLIEFFGDRDGLDSKFDDIPEKNAKPKQF